MSNCRLSKSNYNNNNTCISSDQFIRISSDQFICILSDQFICISSDQFICISSDQFIYISSDQFICISSDQFICIPVTSSSVSPVTSSPVFPVNSSLVFLILCIGKIWPRKFGIALRGCQTIGCNVLRLPSAAVLNSGWEWLTLYSSPSTRGVGVAHTVQQLINWEWLTLYSSSSTVSGSHSTAVPQLGVAHTVQQRQGSHQFCSTD